jgi:Holliday junction resolvase RusA-like endonuclease
MTLRFTVYATPQPQGSIRAFVPKGWKRPVLTSDNPKLKSFRQECAKAAIAALRDQGVFGDEPIAPKGAPVRFFARFLFRKPESLTKRVTEKTTKPDLSKLLRAAEDALTGIVWKDDAQIIEARVLKGFTEGAERAEIAIETANESYVPLFAIRAGAKEEV